MPKSAQASTGDAVATPPTPADKVKGPAQTEPTPVADQWRLEKIYGDPASILIKPAKVSDLLDDCVFVFDTSALLTPYESSKAAIAEIERVLRPLAEQKRLLVPQRALREFANNRGNKIAEAAGKLLALRQHVIDVPDIPSLGNLRTVKALREPHKLLKEQIREFHKALDGLIADMRSINYDDPISQLYRDLFPADCIIKSKKTREQLEEDFARRVKFRIPPGYEDKHIGDLVIWHSIIENGAAKQQNTVFVSNDLKEDWAHTVGERELGQMVASRYELIYEYYQETKGKHYVQIQLAELLKVLKASDSAVRAVQASQQAALATKAAEEAFRLFDVESPRQARRIQRPALSRIAEDLRVAIDILSISPVDMVAVSLHLSTAKARARAEQWVNTTIAYDTIAAAFREARKWKKDESTFGPFSMEEAERRRERLKRLVQEAYVRIAVLR